jgi:chemotaxis protein methyltransferase CheR
MIEAPILVRDLTDAQFEKVRALVFEFAGIHLAITKRQLALNRLARKVVEHQFDSFDSYLNALRSSQTLRQDFVNAMTTNVTSFFRERHHFTELGRRINLQCPSNLRVWSAGCSSGEEPLSILMTVLETIPNTLALNRPFVLATDIDTTILQRAKQGVYSDASLEVVDAGLQQKYFSRADEKNYKVKSQFQSFIQYQELNLSSALWSIPSHFTTQPFQYIFCRNVMIYFSADVQRKLLVRFHKYLEPGGLLFAGHSEMLLHSEDLFESLGQTVFRSRVKK